MLGRGGHGYRLLAMFLAITFVLVAALAWMGWRLLRQESQLAGRRAEERCEIAADLAVAALQKNLSSLETQLLALSAAPAHEQASRAAADLPADSLLLVFGAGGIEAFPRGRLLFYPEASLAQTPAPANLFAKAADMEFRQRDYAKAVAALRPLARHADPVVRAEAHSRLGRSLLKAGRAAEALAAFDELARAGATPVAGLPAELVAREARLLVFEKQKDAPAAQREAAALLAALHGSGWRVSHAAFEFYTAEAARVLGTAASAPPRSLSASAAVESLWEKWRSGEEPPAGRRIFREANQAILVVWRGTPERLAAFALGGQYVEAQWLKPLQPMLGQYNTRLALADSDGHAVLGAVPGGNAPQSVRLASATQLPWTVHAVIADPSAAAASGARALIVTGAATLLLLVLAGTYFIGRAAAREVAFARLETEFVSSVSHEFRTPITAIRQLTELLAGGRVESDTDRNEYYQVLAREGERLHRLVEGLLTFGRLEAGAMHFRFQPLDSAGLVNSVVEEFQRDAEARGHHVEFHGNGSSPQLWADRAALSCVLWNLLDNAVKYSPDCSTVWVEIAREKQRVAIRVRDQGVGIPPEEQQQIFQKFVRGAAAKTGGIRGAGVGLAMARQIVAAHHGDILVESRPGAGSTFTVLLPEGE